MNIAVFAYSRQGCTTARRVTSCFAGCTVQAYTVQRLAEESFLPLPAKESQSFYGKLFGWADAMVFVGACGIAVRAIAPHVRSKQTDPAVLCVDELGRFIIPLLAGHIGGANAAAQRLAAKLGATPVITTATDLNHRFAVDSWAVQQGFLMDDMACAKAVSAAILEQDIPLWCDLPISGSLPAGLVHGNSGPIGICISWQTKTPFGQTLRLIPRVLQLGIGCRRGTPAPAIEKAVAQVLNQHDIDPRAVKGVASIDLKANEPGLLQFCRSRDLPCRFFSAAQLQSVEGEFTPSPFVQSVTGVDNVCERAALAAAHRLIVKKTALDGVTVAVAAETPEVHFG